MIPLTEHGENTNNAKDDLNGVSFFSSKEMNTNDGCSSGVFTSFS